MSRILLIGCGAKKAAERCEARDLYTGPLFRSRRAYAEWTGDPWWIVSAGHTLVHPEQDLAPYEQRIHGLSPLDRCGWAIQVVDRLLAELPDATRPSDVTFELHMGAGYRGHIQEVLRALGFSAWCPLEGMGIGEQRGWYAERIKLCKGRAS